MFFDVKMQSFFRGTRTLLNLRRPAIKGTGNVSCFPSSAHALSTWSSLSRDVCRLERELDHVDQKRGEKGCGKEPEIEWSCSGPRASPKTKLPQPQRTFGLLQAGTPLSSTLWYFSEMERAVMWNSMGSTRKKMMLFVDKTLHNSSGESDACDIAISLSDHQTEKVLEETNPKSSDK